MAVRFVLFDLGGVLVELTGVPVLLGWLGGRIDERGLTRKWLASPSVRAFESGRCDAEAFASGVVAELALPVSPREFLREFASWARGPLVGAVDLLASLRGRVALGCLSNTNAVHWPRIESFGLLPAFDHVFASFQTGLLKPDREAFVDAATAVGMAADEILFLDDSAQNVDAARGAGLRAQRVVGVVEASAALADVFASAA